MATEHFNPWAYLEPDQAFLPQNLKEAHAIGTTHEYRKFEPGSSGGVIPRLQVEKRHELAELVRVLRTGNY